MVSTDKEGIDITYILVKGSRLCELLGESDGDLRVHPRGKLRLPAHAVGRCSLSKSLLDGSQVVSWALKAPKLARKESVGSLQRHEVASTVVFSFFCHFDSVSFLKKVG